jgi:hypothetical protein
MAKVLTPEQLSQQKQSAQLGVAMAVGQLVGDLTVGLLQNKTQRDFNKGRLAQLEEDSRLKQLNEEQKLVLQKKIANAVNDVARLRIYEETIADLGAASIYASASVYAERFKAQSAAETRGYIVLAGLAALLIGGTIYVVKKNKQ